MIRIQVAIVALLVAAAMPAQAFVRSVTKSTRLCLYWPKRELPFVVNDQGSRSAPGCTPYSSLLSVRKSFETWQDVGCTDVRFVSQGITERFDVGMHKDPTQNINLVVWRPRACADVVPEDDPCREGLLKDKSNPDCSNRYNCWMHETRFRPDAPADVIALTTVRYVPSTGEIADADIELYDWNQQTGTAAFGKYFTCVDPGPGVSICREPGEPNCIGMDVQNTMTHEIGHFLGLDHEHAQALTSTMATRAADGETMKRRLDAETVRGICSVYPDGQMTDTCRAPAKIAGNLDLGCSHGAMGLTSLVGLAGLLSRRRSRI